MPSATSFLPRLGFVLLILVLGFVGIQFFYSYLVVSQTEAFSSEPIEVSGKIYSEHTLLSHHIISLIGDALHQNERIFVLLTQTSDSDVNGLVGHQVTIIGKWAIARYQRDGDIRDTYGALRYCLFQQRLIEAPDQPAEIRYVVASNAIFH